MERWVLSAIESLIFIGMFLAAVYLFIPKGVKFWRLWKESGKTMFLSNAIASGVGAFFLLAALFLMFIQAIGGHRA